METWVSTLWVRVVSKENGNTYYWKGNQWNDPVKSDQANWSAGGIDNTGNFTTYKINTNADTPTKTFDRTFNRISNDMDVTTSLWSDEGSMINPVYSGADEITDWTVIGDGCKPNKPVLHTWLKPNYDGEYWSNQYCYGGITTSLNDKGGPGGCYTSRTGCNDPDIKGCEKWCSPPQLDGCAGKFTVPRPVAGPGDTSEDYGSLKYLERIINAFDNPYNGVSLTFDGVWTMSEHVFTKYEGATNFYQRVRIKPPAGYACGNANLLYMESMKYDANRKSSVVAPEVKADGTCVYYAGNKGGILLPEIIPQISNSCSVMVGKTGTSSSNNAITVNVNPKASPQPVQLSAYGLSSDPRVANAGLTNLWIANQNFTAFNLTGSINEIDEYYGTAVYSHLDLTGSLAGKRIYKSTMPCTSSNQIPCNPFISVGLNMPKAGTDVNYKLPIGKYVAFCDMQNPPTDPVNGKCSGNPLCSFNRSKLDAICKFLGITNCLSIIPTGSCTGYKACDEQVPTAVTQPTDLAVINAQCTPVCNTCELPGASDGCGGTCGGQSFCVGGTNEDEKCTLTSQCPGGTCALFASDDYTPNVVNNVKVEGSTSSSAVVDACHATATQLTFSWEIPTGAQAGIQYESIIYRKGAFPTTCNPATTLNCDGTEAGTAWLSILPPINSSLGMIVDSGHSAAAKTIALSSLEDLGPDLVFAVRAINPKCSYSKRSPWVTRDLKLKCANENNLTVRLFKDNGFTQSAGRCLNNGSSELIDVNYDVEASLKPPAPFDLSSAVIGGLSKIALSHGTIQLTNLWYLPDNADDGKSLPYRITLDKSAIDLTNENLVITCPAVTGNTKPSQDLNVPSSIATNPQYVDFFFKEGFPAWWRTVGGLIGAHNGPIISLIPLSCVDDGNCIDSLASANPALAKDAYSATAGIPSAGNDNTVSAGTGGGGKTQNYSTLNAEQYAGNSPSLKLLPTENYAYFLDKINKLEITPRESLTNLNTDGPYNGSFNYPADDGSKYYIWKIPGGTISIDPAKWNLEDSNPALKRVIILVDGSVTFLAPSPDANLIKTNANSFLLVVAKDRIIFENSIGRDISGVGVNNITPVIGGIFIAGSTLEINGVGADTVTDNQFVGKGVFAGLGGVVLGRSYDDLGPGRLLNNLQPAELFIHDPQMVLNTPKFLREPMMSYQEVL